METNTQTLNPWISMWTKPRATIQQIIDTNPEHLVLLLAAVAGISQVLDRATMRNLGDTMSLTTILVMALVAGPIAGLVGLYVGGALLRWTGKWIGGDAPIQNIRAAIAWSSVPVIWALLLWVAELALVGKELFTSEMPSLDDSLSLAFIMMGLASVEVIIGIWALVLFLKCLGQVQGFSAWKALGNALLAMSIILVPIFALAVGIPFLLK